MFLFIFSLVYVINLWLIEIYISDNSDTKAMYEIKKMPFSRLIYLLILYALFFN